MVRQNIEYLTILSNIANCEFQKQQNIITFDRCTWDNISYLVYK